MLLLPLCASILCTLIGLGVGIARKNKLGVTGNLLVLLGFVLWVVAGYLGPSYHSRLYEARTQMKEFETQVNAAHKGDAEARSKLEKRAEEGDPLAQLGMGSLYRRQDKVQAYKWVYLAVSATEGADEGPDIAVDVQRWGVSSLNQLAQEMTPEQIVEAEELGKEWQRKNSWWRKYW